MKVLHDNLSWWDWFLTFSGTADLDLAYMWHIQEYTWSVLWLFSWEIYLQQKREFVDCPCFILQEFTNIFQRKVCLSVSFDPSSFPRGHVKASPRKALAASLGLGVKSLPPYIFRGEPGTSEWDPNQPACSAWTCLKSVHSAGSCRNLLIRER